MQGRQRLVLIRLSPPKFAVPLRLGRRNHIQHSIFSLHKSVNKTDADRVKLLDGWLIVLMVFTMVLLIIIHEEWVEAFAEG